MKAFVLQILCVKQLLIVENLFANVPVLLMLSFLLFYSCGYLYENEDWFKRENLLISLRALACHAVVTRT